MGWNWTRIRDNTSPPWPNCTARTATTGQPVTLRPSPVTRHRASGNTSNNTETCAADPPQPGDAVRTGAGGGSRTLIRLHVKKPGIEPVAKIALNSGNAGFRYVKRRETTRNDLRIRKRC